jgi:hypothetical protein
MSNYHVTNPKGSNDWKVIKEKAERASVIVSTQREAEKIAKELSGNSGGGEVIIHKPNGGPIRDKDTVAPGRESSVIDKKH